MKNIVVLGSVNTDLIIHTDQFPKPGETVKGSDFKTMPGGKGANQAVAAARLGAQVSLIGCLGSDHYGKAALENLRSQHVDVQQVCLDHSTPSGLAFIIIDAHGDNSIIVSPGANGKLDQGDLESCINLFTPQTILVTQLEIPSAIVASGIRAAKVRGAHIILNPSPALQMETGMFKNINTLILNETELATLSGCTEIQPGLRALQELGEMQIVLTLGAQGCILRTADRERVIPAHKVNVVDTTGAGDAFIGAFATALADGLDFFTAGEWGNAAGALATTSLGAQSSLPDRMQLAEFLKNPS